MGKVVIGAYVKIENVQTGVFNQMTTNKSGIYDIVGLIPGQYIITIERQGFKQVVQKDVSVRIDTTTRIDVDLQVGSIMETVTINTEPTILQTERAEISQTLDRQKLNNLPMLGRNISRLIILVPGATFNSGQLLGHPENATLSTAADVGIPNINQGTVFTNGLPGFSIGGPTGTLYIWKFRQGNF